MAGEVKRLDVYLAGKEQNNRDGHSKVGMLRLAFERACWTSRMYKLQLTLSSRRLEGLLKETETGRYPIRALDVDDIIVKR